jgi:Flp pilus assembly protein TadD
MTAGFAKLTDHSQSRRRYLQLKESGDRCAAAAPDQARRLYNQAAAVAPDEPGPYVGLGILGLNAGRIEEAERAFTIASRLRPDCAEAYNGLAIIFQRRGHFAAAFDMYLRCLELDIDNLVALLGLFQTSCQMGSFGKIIHYLELYLEAHPMDASVLFCLATLYVRDGKLRQARDALTAVLSIEPSLSEARQLLGQVGQQLARRSSPDNSN